MVDPSTPESYGIQIKRSNASSLNSASDEMTRSASVNLMWRLTPTDCMPAAFAAAMPGRRVFDDDAARDRRQAEPVRGFQEDIRRGLACA